MQFDETWKYLSPTKIVFGVHAFESLKKYVLELNITKKILLVTGLKSMHQFGYVDICKRMLYDKSLYVFDQIKPNPTLEDLEEAIQFLKSTEAELVISLGGGSVLDAGKILAAMATNHEPLGDYLSGEKSLENKPLPFIAIPTTSGTASEVTCWATLWDMKQKKKFSLSHPWMFPDYAIIDPQLTVHMPPQLTGITGMDALTHAIESCWSKSSQPISDAFALHAIGLIRKNITTAHNEPENLEARSNMSLASLFAGLAFNNTKTAACHSISYPMTIHFDIPHGLAVSITLKEVIQLNNQAIPQKVRQIIEAFGSDSLESFVVDVPNLMQSIRLPIRLRDLNLKRSDLDIIIQESVNPDRMKNNPVELSHEEIGQILNNVY
jgi:phosphonate metabolism-associated iron-containing alcohol dehydrogenase